LKKPLSGSSSDKYLSIGDIFHGVQTKRPETQCLETKHPGTKYPKGKTKEWRDKTSCGTKHPEGQNFRQTKLLWEKISGDMSSVGQNVHMDKNVRGDKTFPKGPFRLHF
jgi:hypothetical protein